MTITLRPYQQACVSALFDYFTKASGNPLAVCPTGSGKSLIMAAFIKEAVTAFPSTRILLATHRAELIEQDAKAIRTYWPEADVGVYSAGLGSRQIRPITVAGVQSIAHVEGLPAFDLLLIDEAHLVPKDGDGQYLTLIARLRVTNPDLKVVGFTATPYRLSGGRLTRGANKIFTSVAYDIPVQTLVDDGYLSPLVSPPSSSAGYATSGVTIRAGDFAPGELARRVEEQNDVTRAALTEAAALAATRQHWLVFCVSIEHARQAAAELFALGVSAQVVTGAVGPSCPPSRLVTCAPSCRATSSRLASTRPSWTP
jgi:DNA repair protein RadD